mgnify:CR=1 FL=1
MGDDLGEESAGIPRCIALPYLQISRRLGRAIPFLSFCDQSSLDMKIKGSNSTYPYVGQFDNMRCVGPYSVRERRWPSRRVVQRLQPLFSTALTLSLLARNAG